MDLPKGFAKSLGGDDTGAGDDESSASESSMLEQHLSAFKRALDSGNMKSAASCFKAAMAEAGTDEEPDAGEGGNDEEY